MSDESVRRIIAREAKARGDAAVCEHCGEPAMATPGGAVPYVHVTNGKYECPK